VLLYLIEKLTKSKNVRYFFVNKKGKKFNFKLP
jgi:hypothetical protein